MLPQQSSTVANDVDELFGFIMFLTVIFFVIILGMTVYFVMRYRHNEKNKIATTDLDHNTLWEGAWAFIPLLLCLVLFVWGFRLFIHQGLASDNSLEVNVTARQWAWQFDYANGTTADNLYAPAGKPVKLVMQSEDVLHSFFIPDFRVKSDVIPNRYTTVWFEAPKAGEHKIFCTEYCGRDHSNMNRTVHVLSPEDYEAKMAELLKEKNKSKSPAEMGQMVYKQQCASCHSVDGSKKIGPSWLGLYGRKGQSDKGEYVADENYITESILYPGRQVVAGYPNGMNSFKGKLTSEDINNIIAYIKTLKK
jgi:cytochrome c oxidase subunit 2